MTSTYTHSSIPKAHESGCYPRVLVGEALRNVARQHGLTVFPDESDIDLNRRVTEMLIPIAGVASQYP